MLYKNMAAYYSAVVFFGEERKQMFSVTRIHTDEGVDRVIMVWRWKDNG